MPKFKLKKSALILVGSIGGLIFLAGGTFFIKSKKANNNDTIVDIPTTELTPLTKEQLTSNTYYVKKKDGNFYKLPEGTLCIDTENQGEDAAATSGMIAAYADPENRLLYFTSDDAAIPTVYSDEVIAYTSPDGTEQDTDGSVSIPSIFYFERYKDEGYSIGVHGLRSDGDIDGDETGTPVDVSALPEGMSKKYHAVCSSFIFCSGSDFDKKISLPEGNQLIIDKVGNIPLSSQNMSSGGTIKGLTKNAIYKTEAYDGTKYIGDDVIADTHMLTSFEVFTVDDYNMNEDGYLTIKIPDDFWSGYYFINGFGLFKYINHPAGQGSDDIDLNTPYILEQDKETGEVKLNPANGQKLTKVTGTSENATYDPENEEEEATAESDLPITNTDPFTVILTYTDNKDAKMAPVVSLIDPDGVVYDFISNTDNKNTLIANVTTGKIGTWTVKMSGLNNRKWKVNYVKSTTITPETMQETTVVDGGVENNG